MFSLSHCCQSFPSLGVTVHLASLACPPALCRSLRLLWGQLRLSAGAAPVCSRPQRPQPAEPGVFSCGSARWPCYTPHTEAASLIVWLQSAACTARGKVSGRLWWHHPWVCCGFISISECGSSTGVCSWGCPGGLGSAPVRARCGGGAAAWVAGVLAAPGTQGSWWLSRQEMQRSRRGWRPVLVNTL